jgi:hypothetical protein
MDPIMKCFKALPPLLKEPVINPSDKTGDPGDRFEVTV